MAIRTVLILATLLLTACQGDRTSTIIAIHPDASSKREDIVAAVNELNARAGQEVFTVVELAGGESALDAATVHVVAGWEDERIVGVTSQDSADGIEVYILARTRPDQIAHELCHAAGLEHVDDTRNLMHKASRSWDLNAEQRAHLIGMM